MKSKYFRFLPFLPLFLKFINSNSIIFKIIKAFFSALLISNFIYLSFFENLFLELLNPFLSIYGLVILLRSKSKMSYFLTGFFIGILWFWWIGLSSIYFNLSYLIPVEIFIIGIIYGVLFLICYFLHFDFLRLCGIFLLSFIHPFGFDWLNFGILSVYGIFDANYKGAVIIFLIAYFYYERYISRYYKIGIILILILIGLQYEQKFPDELKLDYKLIQTHIPQDQKFIQENLQTHSNMIINQIIQAIKEKKELIVFPETAFAFALNKSSYHIQLLKELSHKIIIITGAISLSSNNIYNSTYIFNKGKIEIFNKYYLVPFGEEIPIFKKLFKKIFYDLEEFSKGSMLNRYSLNGQNITNVICYEATKEQLYKDSKIIIAISNNAWFNHSIQHRLQNILLRFYANNYNVSIYHSTNGEGNAVIKPKEILLQKIKDKMKLFKASF
ncbi:apolipoprotein N-acyltransferase [Campylobacter insulaenigrae]|uniref:apolipoprotein N-acyltransferase n=1 Tax=Campylobacter insulaenigrae TaxID=260714 RepID=UPI0021527256|nr:apolipoprotein N-acyltransferase [Campylobacter insulaenigrae]MCR6574284.1 apolipoprotein N-acyltransferase [Campylobacter insulaenigrae]MCR6579368.1 apolipoprotein N-acyltransferase [Campylobacter insulaenigrae]MCR6586737.1 apolipoprotein N-acyltransferase [Campylobacter insulaenigrae]